MNRGRSFALLWCWLYTAAAPPEVRDRRRDELAAHRFEHRAAYGSSARARLAFFLATVRGAWDDLVWCHEERLAARLDGLPSHAAFSTSGSLAVSGVAITSAFVLSLFVERWQWLRLPQSFAVALAAGVLICNAALRLRRRFVE